MTEGVEKRVCEPECAQFLNRLGWSIKLDPEARCNKCFNVIYPTHTGASDYLGVVRRPGLTPLPVIVEVKGIEEKRFPFSKIEFEQFKWAKNWLDTIGSKDTSYIWIQIGPDAINARSLFRRQVWLVGTEVVWKVMNELLERGMKSIPMNAQATNRKAEQPFNAEALLSEWKLRWIPSFGWWLPEVHPFWDRAEIRCYTYEQVSKSKVGTRSHPGINQDSGAVG